MRTPLRAAVDRTIARLLARAPALGRAWASRAARAGAETIPWTPFTRPLGDSRATLITTGGVHRHDDVAFDMTNADGDASFRVIPRDTPPAALRITHDYYDHRDADRDVNLVFPLERFRELVARGVLGGLTREHFSFMGHITGPLVRTLTERTIPTLLGHLRADPPDFVVLVPA